MTQRVYFTSDLHLGHKNIMTFSQRNHNSMTEMHEAIVEQWNNTVRKEKDIVYVLGDVCMDISELHWLDQMQGQKRLILGNHDQFDYNVYKKHFSKVQHFHKDYKGIVLSHIPIHPNELVYRSWKWNIHGHIHDVNKNIPDSRYFNVNIDVVGYAPISLEEVRENLK